MRVVTDDGVGLEVVERGTGPTLLLVHGFGGAKEDFADHARRAGGAPSRGHVRPPRPRRERLARPTAAAYSLDRLAADTLAVADAVGADQFRLLGHSMGGMVVRRVVLAHPERVEALVLMDTSPGPVPGIDAELLEMAAVIALGEGMDGAQADHGRVPAARHARVRAAAGGAARLPGVQRPEVGDALGGDVGDASAARSGTSPTSSPRSPAVACPTLVHRR